MEIRRFGYNLDHGGVSGGLKVLVDDVQQNQTSQGHGQGYLGQLKSLSPELVQEVQIVNGPFARSMAIFRDWASYIYRRASRLPNQYTLGVQGGSFNSERVFAAFSPELKNTQAYLAYDGSHTDGPFLNPLDYVRNNVSGNLTHRLNEHRQIGSNSTSAQTGSIRRDSFRWISFRKDNWTGSDTSIRRMADASAAAWGVSISGRSSRRETC